MIILEDTRQQDKQHEIKHKYFEKKGIEVRRTKLYVGDYTLPTNQSVCVDSKNSCEELISDICGKQHERFRRELLRAQEANIKLYILVENEGGLVKGTKDIYNPTVRSIDDLYGWKNPRLFIMKPSSETVINSRTGRPMRKWVQKYPTATRGEPLAKACYTMQKKYGCEFVFCTPDESGAMIVRLLRGEG